VKYRTPLPSRRRLGGHRLGGVPKLSNFHVHATWVLDVLLVDLVEEE
jgi:hypothetical protein